MLHMRDLWGPDGPLRHGGGGGCGYGGPEVAGLRLSI